MASSLLLLLTALTLLSSHTAESQSLVSVKCEAATGVIGQNTKISCSLKTASGDIKPIITAAALTRKGEYEPVWFIHTRTNTVTGDSRFTLPNNKDPSLLLTNTVISDEGEYYYNIQTDRGGVDDIPVKLSVAAKYNDPTVYSRPEKIEDGRQVDMFCDASSGYPAGSINWFDQFGTNWTKSAVLQVDVGDDKLVRLSSKLSFRNMDSSLAPFKCVVLNSKYEKETESVLQMMREGGDSPQQPVDSKSLVKIIAPVLVIGSLIVGLLVVLLVCRRNVQQYDPADTGEDDPKMQA